MPRSIKKSPPAPSCFAFFLAFSRLSPLFEFCCASASAKEFKTDFLARLCRANSSLPKWLLWAVRVGIIITGIGQGVELELSGHGWDWTRQWFDSKKRFHSKIFYSLGPSQNENFCAFSLCILLPYSLRPAIFFQTFQQLFIPWTQPDDLLRLLRIEYHILIYSGSWLGDSPPSPVVGGVAKLFNSCPYKIIYECRTVNSVCVVCVFNICKRIRKVYQSAKLLSEKFVRQMLTRQRKAKARYLKCLHTPPNPS